MNPIIAAVMAQINGLSPPYGSPIPEQSAMLILPGPKGHDYRVWQGTDAFKFSKRAHYLFIAGNQPSADLDYDLIRSRFNTEVEEGKVIIEERSENTLTQVQWAFGQQLIRTQTVQHLIICSAACHTPRAFLTALSVMNKFDKTGHGRWLSALPVYDPANPLSDLAYMESEVEKIERYQIKGDVATLDEYRAYMQWRLNGGS
jgi:hypothetical protein